MPKFHPGLKIVHLKMAILATKELTLKQCVLQNLTNFFDYKNDETLLVALSSTDKEWW
jgi:hypothetical protein